MSGVGESDSKLMFGKILKPSFVASLGTLVFSYTRRPKREMFILIATTVSGVSDQLSNEKVSHTNPAKAATFLWTRARENSGRNRHLLSRDVEKQTLAIAICLILNSFYAVGISSCLWAKVVSSTAISALSSA